MTTIISCKIWGYRHNIFVARLAIHTYLSPEAKNESTMYIYEASVEAVKNDVENALNGDEPVDLTPSEEREVEKVIDTADAEAEAEVAAETE